MEIGRRAAVNRHVRAPVVAVEASVAGATGKAAASFAQRGFNAEPLDYFREGCRSAVKPRRYRRPRRWPEVGGIELLQVGNLLNVDPPLPEALQARLRLWRTPISQVAVNGGSRPPAGTNRRRDRALARHRITGDEYSPIAGLWRTQLFRKKFQVGIFADG